MKTTRCATVALLIAILTSSALAATRGDFPVTPGRNTTVRGGYTIDTIGDTLGQAPPQNTRLIIRVFGPDKKVVKPSQIALVDKSGGLIKPVFREDRKVGHEENTGLPVSINRQTGNSGLQVGPVGVDLNKVFGPKGSYAYSKVDWPKQLFTSEKQLQIALSNGQTFLLPLSSLAK